MTPTLYEWAGGAAAFERLTERFYDKVVSDDLIGPMFAHMDRGHPRYVAMWLAEVFGGPARYTDERGGYAAHAGQHLGKAITEPQRRRWVNLLADAADEVGLPGDPEFRAAFMGYIEWGTRLALANSQPGAAPPPGRRSRTGAGVSLPVPGLTAVRTTRRCTPGRSADTPRRSGAPRTPRRSRPSPDPSAAAPRCCGRWRTR